MTVSSASSIPTKRSPRALTGPTPQIPKGLFLGSVFIEPEAVVTYVPPWRLDIGDLEYFQLRWSEAWLEASIRRLTKKYNLSETDPEMDALRYWVRSHRRLRLTWIDQLPRIIGKKAARVISRRLVEPLEIAHNRARFYRRNKDIRYANSSAT
jgi:hypothetical protein